MCPTDTISRSPHNKFHLLIARHFTQHHLVFTYFQHKQLCENWDSHSIGYEDCWILGCNTILSGSYWHWMKSVQLTMAVVSTGKTLSSLFVTSNQCIPVKNTLGWNAVMLCVYKTYSHFLKCSVWLQLCINFALGLLQTKHLKNGNQWNDDHAVTETRVFDRIYMFFPTHCCKC
jgi:hypothetical protein